MYFILSIVTGTWRQLVLRLTWYPKKQLHVGHGLCVDSPAWPVKTKVSPKHESIVSLYCLAASYLSFIFLLDIPCQGQNYGLGRGFQRLMPGVNGGAFSIIMKQDLSLCDL